MLCLHIEQVPNYVIKEETDAIDRFWIGSLPSRATTRTPEFKIIKGGAYYWPNELGDTLNPKPYFPAPGP